MQKPTLLSTYQWHNAEREHSSLSKQTSDEAYFKAAKTFNPADFKHLNNIRKPATFITYKSGFIVQTSETTSM